jgi:TolB-like protein
MKGWKFFVKFLVLSFIINSEAHSQRIKVGAMPFINLSKEQTLKYLEEELPKEILLEIAKDERFYTLGSQEVKKAISEAGIDESILPLKAARIVGEKTGAEIMIFGDFQKIGDQVRISTYISSVKDEKVIDTVKVVGTSQGLFTLIEEVVRKTAISVKKAIPPSEEKQTTKPIKKPTGPPPPVVQRKSPPPPSPAIPPPPPKTSKEDEATYRLLEAQITKPGENALYYYNKGVELSDGSDMEISYYRKAIELDPTLADAYYNLGIIYSNRGQKETAIMYFEEFLKYSKDEEKKLKVKFFISQLKGEKEVETPPSQYDRKLAEKWYNEGVKLSNNSDEEMKYYMLAIQADPTFDRPHYNLAVIYYQRGMFNEAIREYEEYLKWTNDPPEEKENVRKIVDYLKSITGK